MSVAVRAARAGDGAVLVEMVRALADSHGELDHFHARALDFDRALAAPDAVVGALIAEADGVAAGCAIWHRSFATFRGAEVMYLEDLSVLPEFRRRGIARALLAGVAGLARGKGYPSVYWLMMDWNDGARALYESCGVEIEAGVNVCRLHGAALERLAQ